MQMTGLDNIDIVLCTTCGRLRGTVDVSGGTYRQRCVCERSRHRALKEPHIGDFATYIELCYACVMVPIPSGSKFSLFFCPDCKERVMEVNRRAGGTMIPIGRHSLMAGVTLAGPEVRSAPAIRSFALGLGGLFGRIGGLYDWSRARVVDILQDSPWKEAGEVPIDDYLAHVNGSDRSARRDGLFLQLCAHFGAPELGAACQ